MITLRPHQDVAAAFMASRARAILGDAPGLGKTFTTVEALRRAGHRAPEIVVIAPAIAREVWRDAFRRLPLSDAGVPDVFSYNEIVASGANAERKRARIREAQAIVLDEAHYLANPTSQRTKLILGREGFARAALRVYALSGTIMRRNPMDLWPILMALAPEVLRAIGTTTSRAFLNKFCVYRETQYGIKVLAAKHLEELRAAMASVYLERDETSAGVELPPLDFVATPLVVKSPPSLAQFPELEEAIARAMANGDSLATAFTSAEGAQLRRLLGLAKAGAAAEMIVEEYDGPCVVFAYHLDVIEMLAEALRAAGLRVAVLTGATSEAGRVERVEGFQAGRYDVFLGQIIACQTALTLTRARRGYSVEPWWAADTNWQAAKRLHRIGQAHPVLVRALLVPGTIDDAIWAQHERETKMMTQFRTAEGRAEAVPELDLDELVHLL